MVTGEKGNRAQEAVYETRTSDSLDKEHLKGRKEREWLQLQEVGDVTGLDEGSTEGTTRTRTATYNPSLAKART